MSKKLLIAARVCGEDWPSPSVRELTFEPRHREAFPPFEPGDHIQVQHTSGVRRDYSVCNPATDFRHYTVAIQREDDGRGGSILFHDGVEVGDDIFVSFPQEGIRVNPTSTGHCFIAGGIGITAIVGLLNGLRACDAPKALHYAVRSIEGAAYVDMVAALCPDVTIYDASRGGRADVSAIAASVQVGGTLYYCGPQRMMKEIDSAVADWPTGCARSELYSPVALTDERLGDPFDARIGVAGPVVHVPDNKSLLRTLLANGIPMDYSCEGGICSSCVVELISGEVVHQDSCLSNAGRDHAMTSCVSRGVGEIIIQI